MPPGLLAIPDEVIECVRRGPVIEGQKKPRQTIAAQKGLMDQTSAAARFLLGSRSGASSRQSSPTRRSLATHSSTKVRTLFDMSRV